MNKIAESQRFQMGPKEEESIQLTVRLQGHLSFQVRKGIRTFLTVYNRVRGNMPSCAQEQTF